ncbi:MAG: NAD-dependent epimerase/dehydratase family protein [Gemmatimonadales bacterium]
MKVMVTGASGFVGRHLVAHLSTVGGVTGVGVSRRAPAWSDPSWRHVAIDVTELPPVLGMVREFEPDVVFHLADPAMDARARATDFEPYAAALKGWRNVLEAVRLGAPRARVLFASSSAVYGKVLETELPIRESVAPRPLNQQGVAKASQELLAGYYGTCFGLHIVTFRTFNLVGPDLSEDFVCSALAKQLAQISAGLREPVLEVGNLDPVRDYLDIRDAVVAYWRLAENGLAGEVYNVCSGVGYTVRQVLSMMLERDPGSSARIAIRQAESRQRTCDIPVSLGSFEKIRKHIAWTPGRPLAASIADLCEAWGRAVVSGGAGAPDGLAVMPACS